MIKKTLTSFLMCIALISFANSTAVAGSAEDKIQAFFKLVDEGKAGVAVDTLMTQEMHKLMGPQIQELAADLNDWTKKFGKTFGNEKLLTEEIGDRLQHHVYIAFYKGMPVTYSFFLYHEEDDWHIVRFSFNTKYQNLVRYKP